MTVIPNTDIGGIIMLRLKSFTEMETYVQGKIYLEWPSNPPLKVPTVDGKFLNCIMIEPGKGGAGDIGLGLREERVDIKYYGANKYTANVMYRLGTSILVPADHRTKTGFTVRDTRVYTVFEEGTGALLADPGAANWPYRLGTYIFRYGAIPIS